MDTTSYSKEAGHVGNPAQLDGAQFFWLVAAMFTVTLGYGVLLPILPALIERFHADPSDTAISYHTGLLMGTFMFALVIFAPMWGHISDRIGRRTVILIGLAGHIVSLVAFALVETMWLAYVVRAFSGIFLSAVQPVGFAYVSETSSRQDLGRRLAWTSGASLSGSVIGPALTGGIYAAGKIFGESSLLEGSISLAQLQAFPIFVAAILGLPVLAGVFIMLPDKAADGFHQRKALHSSHRQYMLPLVAVLTINLLVTFGHGGFEVGITLNGRLALGQGPAHIGLMFAMCSVVMIGVQTVVYTWPGFLARLNGQSVAVISLAAMGLGFVFLPGSGEGLFMSLMVGLIAAGVGGWSAASNTYLAIGARNKLGVALGLQTAAASVGQGLGSIAGGSLYAALASSSFFVMSALMLFAAVLCLLWRRFSPASSSGT